MAAGLFLLIEHKVLLSSNPFKQFKIKWNEIKYVIFSTASAIVVSEVLKSSIQAKRPFLALKDVQPLFLENGFAFPSGHTTFFFALAFAIFFHHKKAGYWFMLCAFVIGVARIIAGVHFPVDILGGFILGLAIAYFLKEKDMILYQHEPSAK